MAIASKKIQPSLLKDLWITAGIFSNHYLLERLPQAGPKIWPSDEEETRSKELAVGSHRIGHHLYF